MSDWEPDIRTLRCFVTVAEERNITRAASRLNIAQPALSRKIAKLEYDLKLTLFERSVRGVELTPAGKILLDRAYAIFGQLAQTFHDVTASPERPAGTVIVGMPPTPGEFIAPPLLRRIKDHFPEIEIRFREGFSRELEDWLLNGQISLAVMHNPPERTDISSQELLVEKLHLIGQAGSLEKASYTLAEAASLPLIMPSRANYLRLLADQHAEQIGCSLNVIQRVDGIWHLKALVRDGHGFTLLTFGGVLSEFHLGTLTAAPIVEPEVQWRLCTATKTDQRQNMATREVEAAIADIVKSLVTRSIWH
ncbi:LysR family transcriptional regulator [Notoacmeibacter sp. MSK16QG-6]|uniref:LysR family transcriptional regulator n=1 Tax=Notoacmeibacter sp. MSK16QG-6 TaxID=2957982 RepID=UPI0020A173F8|nr:LysR family transcriptional regulator [Notoacmeibacter sp. MSK16QG-6]MCP1200585.1 LysR family transcriptional regulator [Notoacmeibacter sp. MSK16QG-6]